MDITKSREEFEKWLEEVHGLYGEDIDWEPERNCYRIFGIHLAWCAWQASRESIVVDIPEEMTCREALEQGHTSDYANGFTAAIIQCYAVVRTAGIRIKGESEKC
ncbi:TPA: hypothetical protein ACIU15_000064 [Yersinia enterocolitica]|uniref:Uncharacterized protein n=6 Tax=Yersiniaceae TaxID=1903411 RepID=A0A0T7P753_YEREN|nr:hypothetical protein [Yersinia enterocolitica]OWF68938.1 hypothetical protein B4901_10185 [Yersinia frederiksenii]EKN3342500.1 hypothetical protein [Yersinia enterocolitica]EKN3597705.1 hypothetical protein [Yersinia enterocolitica]EKN3690880.1 hypothetical protein [Yersinia enterocolitica]EKN4854187.1 hypothetical protein [Yersinia enterocolitica]